MRGKSQTVIAAYRPKPGKSLKLMQLVREHRRVLSDAGLVTARPPMILRARSDGTLIEIFEWVSAKAADEAHQHTPIMAMWKKLGAVADFVALSDIAEAAKAFSHFEALQPQRSSVKALAAKGPAARRPRR